MESRVRAIELVKNRLSNHQTIPIGADMVLNNIIIIITQPEYTSYPYFRNKISAFPRSKLHPISSNLDYVHVYERFHFWFTCSVTRGEDHSLENQSYHNIHPV